MRNRIAPGSLYNLPQAPPRIVKIDGRRWGIQTYDLDNGYPQRMESLIKASPCASDTVKMFVKYLVGNGFTDKTFYKSKINAAGLTPDKLLRRNILDWGRAGGFAIHVNWNALYQIESCSFVPFKSCRLGIEPKFQGRIAIHPDWYNTTRWGKYVAEADIDYIWRYNSDPAEIERQVEYAGGWDKYQGQIWWHSNEVDDYPLSPFDEVIDPMITEAKSNTTTKNNVESNFQGKVVYIDKGKTEDKKEREERDQMISGFIGPNGNSVMVVESSSIGADGKANDVPEVVPIKTEWNDKLFEYTDDKTRGQIYRAMGQNAVLHSDLTQGRYNQNQLPESQAYYNSMLTSERLIIEECYSEIFSLFATPINPTNDYTLIPMDVVKIPTITTDSENANAPTDNEK